MTNERTHMMAVFCDFENLALGVEDAKYDKFDIRRVLERLLIKGSIVVKKAYCDWSRYNSFKKLMHEEAFELIDIPHVRASGKNSADIRMVVDALDLCYTKTHVDTFVIVSGDSDFSPLVSKLRENNKMVVGVGVKNSTSDLFISNCDQFIFYDDLVREHEKRRRVKERPKAAATTTSAAPKPANTGNKPGGDPDKAIELVVDTFDALVAERGSEETIWGSMIKQAIKRREPQFNEGYHGFRSFTSLLEAVRDRKLVTLERDEKSGNYLVKPVAD